MYQFVLLMAGLVLLFYHGVAAQIPYATQQVIFLSATLLLGVPHGAADLLVGRNNALIGGRTFSIPRFFAEYLGAIAVFGIAFYFFPLLANLIFILLAAYHFGESDVSGYHVTGYTGIIFSGIYGFFIIAAILLPHWPEVRPMAEMIITAPRQAHILDMIGVHRYAILAVLACGMFVISFYSLFVSGCPAKDKIMFWVATGAMLLVLTQLPMLLGFTFYFVFWHSLRSMHQIVSYLRKNRSATLHRILFEMGFFSFMAIIGIAIAGICIYGYVDARSLEVYLFLGLAVLTAPHMRVMHHMHLTESEVGI